MEGCGDGHLAHAFGPFITECEAEVRDTIAVIFVARVVVAERPAPAFEETVEEGLVKVHGANLGFVGARLQYARGRPAFCVFLIFVVGS